MYICVFFWHIGILFSSGRGSFLVLSAPWHAGSPPGHWVLVWALAEVHGTCSGDSKWQVPSGRDSEHVGPSRPLRTHVQVKGRDTRGKSLDGKKWSGRERDGTETVNHVPDRDFPTLSVVVFCPRRLSSRRKASCSRPDCFPSHRLPSCSHPIQRFAHNFFHPAVYSIPFTTGSLASSRYDHGYNTFDSTAAVHFLAGITLFQFCLFSPAKTTFSSLKLVVYDLRPRLGASNVEKILLLRLNKSSTYQIPGLGKVVRELEALKAEQDAAVEAAFAAKTAVVAGYAS